ncbi:MAG: hypothetical protein SGI74_10890 [Oligoflexia bacterium]|nr:hypothetical protein [Oligoflexia bacterium]
MFMSVSKKVFIHFNKITSTLLLFTCLTTTATANEIVENWQSARAMALGNAYTAIVSDKDALFYNPAALNKIRGLHLTLLDPAIASDALNGYQLYKDFTGSNYSTAIRNFYGKQIWAGISDSLAFSMPNFAIAGYSYTNFFLNLHNPAYSNVTFSATSDYGIIGGMGASLLPGDALRLGFAIKRVTRYGGRVTLGPSTLATLSNSELTSLIAVSGTGYGLDGGLLIELPAPASPTFSLVWQDIGQTRFTPTTGLRAPPALDNNAVAGYSMLFDWTLIKFRPSFEYRHINLQNEQGGKKIHLGAELTLLNIDIRGGVNQGYLSYGVGVDLKYIRVDASSWGTELDTYAGQREDRRYMVQFTLDLNFNPTFGTDNNASGNARPKPYQRR